MITPTGIPCPDCQRTDWRILITRRGNRKVVRVRRCRGCGGTVRTAEKVECNRHITKAVTRDGSPRPSQ